MGAIFGSIAGVFGYLLNFIYDLVNNYGLAIILFTIAVQIILLPFSIKQQKKKKKNSEIQAKLKDLQSKYKNDQVRLGQETMNLYKTEKMSPFSGCLTSILQLIIFVSIFTLVRQPLTYMNGMTQDQIQQYIDKYQISEQSNYKEIDIIREAKREGDDSIAIEMQFLGIDLSNIPSRNWSDWTVYIIPGLYVISSMISMKLTTRQRKKKELTNSTNKNVDEKALVQKDEDDVYDAMESMNKQMSIMIPIMAVSVAIISPLGLALYWLVNNIMTTVLRLILNKFFDKKDEV